MDDDIYIIDDDPCDPYILYNKLIKKENLDEALSDLEVIEHHKNIRILYSLFTPLKI